MSPTDNQYNDTITQLHDQSSSLASTGLDLLPLIVIMLILLAVGVALAIRLRRT